MPIKRASAKANLDNVFGQSRIPAKMSRAGPYARVSTNDRQTLGMQNRAMREYAAQRGWMIVLQVREVNSGQPGARLARNRWRPHAAGRTRAAPAHARQNGRRVGRPATAAVRATEIRKLYHAGLGKSEIARRVQVGQTSVRILAEKAR